ncbi:adenine deaminase C-terminal domain-containing protein [Calidifontibacillus erzurumensis]|uniref:adenine deaminase n=1 Tax=Calidifontibacillus erzurumensis TaxID=2741433 RepID=A0A8J8KFK5_9BACI|nr:adenine deaminase C-terminal domain-containing protein [Calidifontibacillus erzurumensis]NSL53020.1 adenine deaminase [Calidifontibacillus erzurumensis]
MPDRYRWRTKLIREQIAVINGKKSPSIVLKNATYLNQALRKWIKANIWIHLDRIVYVGNDMPERLDGTEVVDCKNMHIVPGYIEPHVHPFQLYNPHSFAQYASQTGTTTLINDNLMFVLLLSNKKAFSLIDELNNLPSSMYWWCRYDPQTEIAGEGQIFCPDNIKDWLEHDLVVQGGELTSWPKALDGDDFLLHWMQETKRLRKPIEGHFPGASEKTLTKMLLMGVDSDHEAITGEDVYKRLVQGYTASLRHSSIRPDLPKLLDEMFELGIDHFDRLLFTTDGSPPAFYKDGVIDKLIKIALEKGVPEIDAYNMASYNVARHYNLDSLHGMIGPGRIAHLNILDDPRNPTPVSVIAKGKWIRRDGVPIVNVATFPWEQYDLKPQKIDWELTMDDLQFSMPFGMEMINSVIMKPYSINFDVSVDELPMDHDESFLMLVDKNGQWRINTIIKGFANKVCGFASSFSNTADFVLIGKSKKDMLTAFRRMKELGGGIVLVENGEVIHEIELKLSGVMSTKSLDELIHEETELFRLLQERGYKFIDPVYTLLFLSSTHLPYIRVTPQGIFDVMKKTVLFPSIMR